MSTSSASVFVCLSFIQFGLKRGYVLTFFIKHGHHSNSPLISPPKTSRLQKGIRRRLFPLARTFNELKTPSPFRVDAVFVIKTMLLGYHYYTFSSTFSVFLIKLVRNLFFKNLGLRKREQICFWHSPTAAATAFSYANLTQ